MDSPAIVGLSKCHLPSWTSQFLSNPSPSFPHWNMVMYALLPVGPCISTSTTSRAEIEVAFCIWSRQVLQVEALSILTEVATSTYSG